MQNPKHLLNCTVIHYLINALSSETKTKDGAVVASSHPGPLSGMWDPVHIPGGEEVAEGRGSAYRRRELPGHPCQAPAALCGQICHSISRGYKGG